MESKTSRGFMASGASKVFKEFMIIRGPMEVVAVRLKTKAFKC